MRFVTLPVAVAAVALSTGVTCAATCGSDVVFTVTANAGISCGGSGPGNDINGIGGDEPAYPTLDSTANSSFLADGALNLTGIGSETGTWEVDFPGGYSNLIIAFQGDPGKTNPDWAYFFLTGTSGILSGEWAISSTNGKKLERAIIYGQLSPVPVPPSLVALASALGLLGFLGWRVRIGHKAYT